MGKNRDNKFNIKPPDAKPGGTKILDPAIVQIEHFEHPIFCFRHTHKNYGIADCSKDQKIALIDQVGLLCKSTWQDIQLAPKHGIGSEKISVNSLKKKPPEFITEDVKYLLALRFCGKHPMLIHRTKFIAHVIFLDHNFTVYDH